MSATLPRVARVLGYAGLVPFIVATAALFVDDPTISGPALYALSVYAAVILSFMGAVHWGLAMRADAAAAPWQLALSVVPALVAWGALVMLSPRTALVVMAAAFAGLLGADLYAAGRGLVPSWYARLRAPLTIVVCALLGVAAWQLGR